MHQVGLILSTDPTVSEKTGAGDGRRDCEAGEPKGRAAISVFFFFK